MGSKHCSDSGLCDLGSPHAQDVLPEALRPAGVLKAYDGTWRLLCSSFLGSIF